MSKYQEALVELLENMDYKDYSTQTLNKCCEAINKLQELIDKATPKKLKNKTDKDGRLLWVCPTCGDVYMKFWNDVETISCRKHCDNCGQKLDWSNNNE